MRQNLLWLEYGKILLCKFLQEPFKPPNLHSDGWLGGITERWEKIWGLPSRWGVGTFDKMCKFQISMPLEEKNENAISKKKCNISWFFETLFHKNTSVRGKYDHFPLAEGSLWLWCSQTDCWEPGNPTQPWCRVPASWTPSARPGITAGYNENRFYWTWHAVRRERKLVKFRLFEQALHSAAITQL